MNRIYKYEINVRNGEITVFMPRKATILSAKMQYGNLYVWAEVNKANELEPRTFVVVGTGFDIPETGAFYKLDFIDTTIDETFVWHVYEHKEYLF